MEDIQKTQIEHLEMKTTVSEKENTQIGSMSNQKLQKKRLVNLFVGIGIETIQNEKEVKEYTHEKEDTLLDNL